MSSDKSFGWHVSSQVRSSREPLTSSSTLSLKSSHRKQWLRSTPLTHYRETKCQIKEQSQCLIFQIWCLHYPQCTCITHKKDSAVLRYSGDELTMSHPDFLHLKRVVFSSNWHWQRLYTNKTTISIKLNMTLKGSGATFHVIIYTRVHLVSLWKWSCLLQRPRPHPSPIHPYFRINHTWVYTDGHIVLTHVRSSSFTLIISHIKFSSVLNVPT